MLIAEVLKDASAYQPFSHGDVDDDDETIDTGPITGRRQFRSMFGDEDFSLPQIF